MRRISTLTAAQDLFGPGKHGFRNGDPANAILATRLQAEWFNALQEEVANVIEAAGFALDPANNGQLAAAIGKMIVDNTIDTLNTARIDVASAATVNLTTAAPNTRHINIMGTTTISGFTVAAGRCYFVRFAGVLTLTNSASLVTQAGANIVTAAGDTCILRATSANTVEVISYTPAGLSGRVSALEVINQSLLSASGWQKLPSGLIIQWGSVAGASVAASSGISTAVTFPIAFPNACLNASVTAQLTSVQASAGIGTTDPAPSGFSLERRNLATGTSQTIAAKWIAIGY
ncbi:gp53-like domain-containing protein [Stutzerimonas sp. KH-1]|jgi:hypothetical protein